MVKTTGARLSLNMISAVTAKGLLRFSTFNGSLTASPGSFLTGSAAHLGGPRWAAELGLLLHTGAAPAAYPAVAAAPC